MQGPRARLERRRALQHQLEVASRRRGRRGVVLRHLRPLARLGDAAQPDHHDRDTHRRLHVRAEQVDVQRASDEEGDRADECRADTVAETPVEARVDGGPPSPPDADRQQRREVIRACDGVEAAREDAAYAHWDHLGVPSNRHRRGCAGAWVPDVARSPQPRGEAQVVREATRAGHAHGEQQRARASRPPPAPFRLVHLRRDTGGCFFVECRGYDDFFLTPTPRPTLRRRPDSAGEGHRASLPASIVQVAWWGVRVGSRAGLRGFGHIGSRLRGFYAFRFRQIGRKVRNAGVATPAHASAWR